MSSYDPFNRKNSNTGNGFEEFYNMIDNFFNDTLGSKQHRNGTFRINLIEKEDKYLLEAELPGVNKEEVSLKVDEGDLIVTVKKAQNNGDGEEKKYIYNERTSPSMSRSVHVGKVEEDKIKAKLENGVLYIDIPKKEDVDKGKEIHID